MPDAKDTHAPDAPDTDATEAPAALGRNDIIAIVNSAITNHSKRQSAQLERLIGEAVARAAAPRPEAPSPAVGDAAAPGTARSDPALKLLQEQLEALRKQNADAEARVRATEDKARKDRTRADLKAALEAKGVKGARAAALLSHLEASGAVRFDDDGNAQLAVKRSRAKNAPPEELLFDLATGVEDWTKTADAAEFLPPPSAPAVRGAAPQAPGAARRAPLYERPATTIAEAARRTEQQLAATGVDIFDPD